MTAAPIIEIFSSIQGEGTHVGERHLFVRFQDCELSCRFCDTPLSFVANRFCRVESPPFSKKFHTYPNPLPLDHLQEILEGFDDRTLAVTGGEPLQKVPFLHSWLSQRIGRKVLLETAGVHVPELKQIIDLIDIVSMDLKLPSSTGMRPFWEEHEEFLRVARGKEVYLKTVVTGETTDQDVERASSLVASVDPSLPFILQPASRFGRFRSVPSPSLVSHWQGIACRILADVRVIPQIHRILGLC